MEDIDVDFLSDILIAPDDLQIADNFIEDFMGELNDNNSTTNHIPIDNNFEWPNLGNAPQQDPLLMHHQTQEQFQVQLIPSTQQQQSNFNQQPLVLQPVYNFNNSNFFNTNGQEVFNSSIQIQSELNLDTLPSFDNTEEIPMVTENNNTNIKFNNAIIPSEINNSKSCKISVINVQQQESTKICQKNGAEIQQGLFNFNNNRVKKQKSRSINSIINDSHSALNNVPHDISTLNKSTTLRNQQEDENIQSNFHSNTDTKKFSINHNITNSLNMQLNVNKPDKQEPNSKQEPKMIKKSNSSLKENKTQIESYKLLDSSEITPIKKSGKSKKKTSHNAIEKKYRSSINDKINELKERVAGPSVKLQKSGILKRALEYLSNIEEVNNKLCIENKMLRSALKKISLDTTNASAINEALRSVNYSSVTKLELDSINPNPNTPPNSSSSCDSDSYYSNFDSESPSSTSSMLSSPTSPLVPIVSLNSKYNDNKPKKTKKIKKENMVEASRVMLCMFTISILFFNPFNLILSSSLTSSTNQPGKEFHISKPINSRVLNSIDFDNFNSSGNTFNTQTTKYNAFYFLSLFFNLILTVFCLVKCYISSEPFIDIDSIKSDFFG